jgi:hypothetical protein
MGGLARCTARYIQNNDSPWRYEPCGQEKGWGLIGDLEAGESSLAAFGSNGAY